MRVLASLLMICSFIVAVAFVGPYLIRTSPVLAILMVIVLLAVVTCLKVRRQEREQDEEVRRCWLSPGPRTGPSVGGPARHDDERSGR